MAGWNESQLRKYSFKLEKIHTLQYDDPKVDSILINNVSLGFRETILIVKNNTLVIFFLRRIILYIKNY